MREFKFRQWTTGWASEKNRMIYLGDIRDEGFSLLQVGEPMQYTGLKDINGNEIYEGDILSPVKYHDTSVNVGAPWMVYYNEERLTFYWTNKYVDNPFWEFPLSRIKYKVVGNIYENPEFNFDGKI